MRVWCFDFREKVLDLFFEEVVGGPDGVRWVGMGARISADGKTKDSMGKMMGQIGSTLVRYR